MVFGSSRPIDGSYFFCVVSLLNTFLDLSSEYRLTRVTHNTADKDEEEVGTLPCVFTFIANYPGQRGDAKLWAHLCRRVRGRTRCCGPNLGSTKTQTLMQGFTKDSM